MRKGSYLSYGEERQGKTRDKLCRRESMKEGRDLSQGEERQGKSGGKLSRSKQRRRYVNKEGRQADPSQRQEDMIIREERKERMQSKASGRDER